MDLFAFSKLTIFIILGYILSDSGYDVWMINARGNRYSRKHTTLNPDKDSNFWKFSWHEIGITDLPATIDFILEKTNQSKLFYVGHSQGCTIFFVMASERPEYNDKIKAHFSLAPAIYMNHLTHPMLQVSAKLVDLVNVRCILLLRKNNLLDLF